MKCWTVAFVALALAACGNGGMTDGSIDGHADGMMGDGANDAVTHDGEDVPSDINQMDQADVPVAPDGGDVVVNDVMDTGPTDTGPTDTGVRDTGPTDAGSCTGPAPTVSITMPTSGATIETCSASGGTIYYPFTANTTGSVTQVTFNWTDGALLVAPPFVITSGPPFVANRLVGGMAATTDPQPLNRAPNALTNTWTVTAAAVDSCGRAAMASVPFTLHYTSHGCPNP